MLPDNHRANVRFVTLSCAPLEPLSVTDLCTELNRICEISSVWLPKLVGLPVTRVWDSDLWLSGAMISHVPDPLSVSFERSRSLLHEWREHGRDLTHIDSTPTKIPFFVRVAIGESSLVSHHGATFVDRSAALGVLKRVSVQIHWPILRLLVLGISCEACPFSTLPIEVVLRIGRFVSPYSFLKKLQ